MKNGFKGKTQEEIENTLNDIIDLYKYLNSKDLFIRKTEKKMSERLIKNESLSHNAEKYLISKLMQESGVAYLSKMREMINDLEKNKKEINLYGLTASKGSPSGIKFNTQVISQSTWDIDQKYMIKIEMPHFLKNCIEDFEKYYKNRHAAQNLIWCLGLSKLQIQFIYLKNKNIAESTLPQLLILLFLEKNPKTTIQKIIQSLKCEPNILLADLPGLVFNPSFNQRIEADKGIIVGNFNIQKKEFKETDEISINLKFSPTRQKFSTHPLVQKKTEAELEKMENEEAIITKNIKIIYSNQLLLGL